MFFFPVSSQSIFMKKFKYLHKHVAQCAHPAITATQKYVSNLSQLNCYTVTLNSNNYKPNTILESINRNFYQPGGRTCATGVATDGKSDPWCWGKHVGTFHWSSSRGGFDTPGGTSPAAWPGLTSRVMCG